MADLTNFHTLRKEGLAHFDGKFPDCFFIILYTFLFQDFHRIRGQKVGWNPGHFDVSDWIGGKVSRPDPTQVQVYPVQDLGQQQSQNRPKLHQNRQITRSKLDRFGVCVSFSPIFDAKTTFSPRSCRGQKSPPWEFDQNCHKWKKQDLDSDVEFNSTFTGHNQSWRV
jgi:hypothetical protein